MHTDKLENNCMDVADIEKEAMMLGEAQRALLADRLVQSVTGDSDERLNAWGSESEDRLDAFHGGILTADPADLVLARLRG